MNEERMRQDSDEHLEGSFFFERRCNASRTKMGGDVQLSCLCREIFSTPAASAVILTLALKA